MRLGSLQALRAVAALGVVLFHLLPWEGKYLPGAAIVPSGFNAGRAGVDLFFCLSGFIVCWTTQGDPGGTAAAGRFLLRRASRIYPVYWVFCVPLVIAALLHAAELHRVGGVPGIAAALLLLPSAAPPLLLVSWTLVFELYFYTAYAALLAARVRPAHRAGALLLWAVFAAGLGVLLHLGHGAPWLGTALSPLGLEFMAGGIAATICRGVVAPRRALASGAAGLALAFASLASYAWLFAHPLVRMAAFGLAGALLLVAAVGAEPWARRYLPRLVTHLGDASYALYLSHLFSLALFGRAMAVLRVGAGPWAHGAAMAGAVLFALAVGSLAHRVIEAPLLRVTRALTRPRAPRPAWAAA